MADNYDSDFENPADYTEFDLGLPKWNTWTNRAIIKSLSGVCFAFSIFGIISVILFGTTYIPSLSTLILFSLGLILWGMFYMMEREYRRMTPNRIR